MNPQSVVGLLEPLRAPDGIGWWPPAPGWWFLALVLLIAIGFCLRWLWSYHRRGASLRQARRSLATIAETELSPAERVAELSTLQRRVAISLAGRSRCAGLTGQPWADFLNELGKDQGPFFDATLAELPYQKEVREADGNDALEATRNWLAVLERPA